MEDNARIGIGTACSGMTPDTATATSHQPSAVVRVARLQHPRKDDSLRLAWCFNCRFKLAMVNSFAQRDPLGKCLWIVWNEKWFPFEEE